MKKITKSAVVLFVLLLCICLAGCGNNNEKFEEVTTSKVITSSNITKAVSSTTESSTIVAEKQATKEATTKKETTAKAKETTKKATTNKAEITKKSTTTKHTTTTSKNVCYLTVDCREILNHKNDLKPGHDSFVPSSGYIVKDYIYTISNNSTVYDVLKKCCDDKGIKLTSSSTQYGIYVAGINNLDEKDCGRYSGWLYSVNDKQPSFSCDKYNVKAGDRIVFHYTCEY